MIGFSWFGVLFVLFCNLVIFGMRFRFLFFGVEGVVIVLFLVVEMMFKFLWVGVERMLLLDFFRIFIFLFLCVRFKFLNVVNGDKYCFVVGLVVRFGKFGFDFIVVFICLE